MRSNTLGYFFAEMRGIEQVIHVPLGYAVRPPNRYEPQPLVVKVRITSWYLDRRTQQSRRLFRHRYENIALVKYEILW